jgi:dTDP-4-dehydrorhamnose 3,5-epimerase
MNFINTHIEGLIIIEPKVFGDSRGYFLETYHKDNFNTHVTETSFIQDNESKSSKGVLRGLHFQKPPFSQAKLVRAIDGEVLDVAVDLRKNSKTYGQHFSILLSGENKKQLFIPRGFAHGFVVLSESAVFSYKVDNLYSPSHDSGILWNDETLKIDWNIDSSKILLSEKDQKLICFKEFNTPFE